MNTPSTYLKKVIVSLVFVALIVFVQSTSVVVSAATNSTTSSSNSSSDKESGWGTRPPQECTSDMKSRDTLKGQVQTLEFQIDANKKAADAADA